MLLRRIGNKTKLAKAIQAYFPLHKCYIEPFFGAGGMFFNKSRAQYNILNDIDGEVFNLFMQVKNNMPDLIEKFLTTPKAQQLWEHWKINNEPEPVWQAIRFLMLSNYGYMGNPHTMRVEACNTSKILLENIRTTQKLLFDVQFTNCDFRKMFKNIEYRKKDNNFIYADPPYLNTDNNYSEGFTENDSADLFNTLQESGCKFAMSEFCHPFILGQAKERGLFVITIGERQTLKNRNIEILVTNYRNNRSLF